MIMPSFELFSNNVCDSCIPQLFPFLFTVGIIACVVFWIYKLVTYNWQDHDRDDKDSPF